MDFEPIVEAPRIMDERIFQPEPMGLRMRLTSLPLPQRFQFQAEQGVFYVDFSHFAVKRLEEVEAVFAEARRRLQEIGYRVPAIVNYDEFELDGDLLDLWADRVAQLAAEHYTTVVRYAASAFTRASLAHTLKGHGLQPNMFGDLGRAQAQLPGDVA